MKNYLLLIIVFFFCYSIFSGIDLENPATSASKESAKPTDDGRVWSVVDFNSDVASDEPLISKDYTKRKFTVVDYEDTVVPPSDVTALSVEYVKPAASSESAAVKKPQTDEEIKAQKDLEWRQWAAQQLKAYEEKKKLRQNQEK